MIYIVKVAHINGAGLTREEAFTSKPSQDNIRAWLMNIQMESRRDDETEEMINELDTIKLEPIPKIGTISKIAKVYYFSVTAFEPKPLPESPYLTIKAAEFNDSFVFKLLSHGPSEECITMNVGMSLPGTSITLQKDDKLETMDSIPGSDWTLNDLECNVTFRCLNRSFNDSENGNIASVPMNVWRIIVFNACEVTCQGKTYRIV